MIIGYLDNFAGARISGWLGSFVGEVYPFITANGKPCNVISSNLSRPDVAESTGLNIDVGYSAEVPHIEYSDIEFKLYAVTNSGAKLIDCKTFAGSSLNPTRFCSVFDALEIARQENSVAITCWEGTHNSISRAYVLYSIVKTQRPAIIITFDMGLSEFGLWQPLINSDAKVLIIPWSERAIYFDLFREIGLSFNTIWICKPYYPSFELSKHIANDRSCFIQDIDSNKPELFSGDASIAKSYEKLSELMARPFLENIPQRSVASINLQEQFKGAIVRHARAHAPCSRERQTDPTKEIRVGYIGTITPEKGLIEAAKIINFFNKTHNYKIKLVVGGIYSPTTIRAELDHLNCETHCHIDISNTNGYLQNIDVVLAGFPIESTSGPIHNKISSKIGDALCNSRPVLVPLDSSVADLENIPGIYLFNHDTFLPQLITAISSNLPVQMDEQYTLAFNYSIFQELEDNARQQGPTFRKLFGYRHDPIVHSPAPKAFTKTNVVLIWKQHDAGLYGRRVDQIARSLVANRFCENIISLEIITKEQLKNYKENSNRIDSDHQYIYADFFEKKKSIFRDGISYENIHSDETESFPAKFNRFLIGRKIYPDNTVFIVFPAITEFMQVLSLIDGYKVVSDIVDNQLSWQKNSLLPLLNQYLTFNHFSNLTVFNSKENFHFFMDKHLANQDKSHFVPNWYIPPTSFISTSSLVNKESVDILYSGNMNDRIDWKLLKSLHDNTADNVKIHLVGSADQALNELTQVLEEGRKFIFHGPMRELDLLRFSRSCDLAIMPHTVDIHSTFMNPMKLNMYTFLGLHCVSTNIPGVDKTNPHLTVCCTVEEFIDSTKTLIQGMPPKSNHPPTLDPTRETIYLNLIDTLTRQ